MMDGVQSFVVWLVAIVLWMVLAGLVGGYIGAECANPECHVGAFVQGIFWPISLPYLLGQFLVTL